MINNYIIAIKKNLLTFTFLFITDKTDEIRPMSACVVSTQYRNKYHIRLGYLNLTQHNSFGELFKNYDQHFIFKKR